jgi:hypothetical protein
MMRWPIILVLAACAALVPVASAQQLPAGTYPVSSMTPGALLTIRRADVCSRGWAGAHRHVTQGQRHAVFLSYGISYDQHGSYELDHLVSLELGGSNVNANLWPEPHHTALSQGPDFGSFTKDRVENAAHAAVCSYRMRLRDAQQLERTDWVALGRQLGVLPP